MPTANNELKVCIRPLYDNFDVYRNAIEYQDTIEELPTTASLGDLAARVCEIITTTPYLQTLEIQTHNHIHETEIPRITALVVAIFNYALANSELATITYNLPFILSSANLAASMAKNYSLVNWYGIQASHEIQEIIQRNKKIKHENFSKTAMCFLASNLHPHKGAKASLPYELRQKILSYIAPTSLFKVKTPAVDTPLEATQAYYKRLGL